MTFTVATVAHVDRQNDMSPMLRAITNRCFIDDGRLGAGRNHLRALRYLARQEDTWGVVFEDDALPVVGISEQIRSALQNAPTPVVSFYLGRGRPPHAQHAIQRAMGMISVDGIDPSFLVHSGMLHCVGYAILTSEIHSLIEYMPWHLRTDTPPDEIISRWAQRGPKCLVSYTWPSLVDHNDELPTTIVDRRSMIMEEIWGAQDEREADPPKLERKAWNVGRREAWDSLCFPF
ncbi:glucosyltransferase [Mycobacterium phage Phabba]|uniref:Glycosyltransferase n=1 Tax=Mycobacterium phage Phabba TaxID=2027899 RepID=A0A249XSR2_9CAUD|nr:glucosyltransferase [Mycobacterium phage Phabba]ASZ74785.1 glycosyltransferase [Mycobacterium phage Phabba]